MAIRMRSLALALFVLLPSVALAKDADEIPYGQVKQAGVDAVSAAQALEDAATWCDLGHEDGCAKIPGLKKKATAAADKWDAALAHFRESIHAKPAGPMPSELTEIAGLMESSAKRSQVTLKKLADKGRHF